MLGIIFYAVRVVEHLADGFSRLGCDVDLE